MSRDSLTPDDRRHLAEFIDGLRSQLSDEGDREWAPLSARLRAGDSLTREDVVDLVSLIREERGASLNLNDFKAAEKWRPILAKLEGADE